MNKRKYLFLVFLLMLLVGCNNKKPVDKLDLEEVEITLTKSEKKEIKTSLDISKLIITVEDNNLVSVDGKVIEGLNVGKTKVIVSLASNPKIQKEIIVTINKEPLTIEAVNKDIYPGDTYVLKIKDGKADDYTFKTSDNTIASIDATGKITGKSAGEVSITVTDKKTKEEKSISITINNYIMEIGNQAKEYWITESNKFSLKISPATDKKIIWSSSNNVLATIQENGEAKFYKAGKVTLIASLEGDEKSKATLTINIQKDPVRFIKSIHQERPFSKDIKYYSWKGSTPAYHVNRISQSVTDYFFEDLNLQKKIIPFSEGSEAYQGKTATKDLLTLLDDSLPQNSGKKHGLVRSGIKHESLEYIIYHDTEAYNEANNADNQYAYLRSEYNKNWKARSWHYTVDEDKVIQSLPDDEVAWQGDSYDAYAKAIGIETCVNDKSDIENTWHRMGKLIAKILVQYDLNPTVIKQHNHMVGKNCPHTLRANNLYDHAIDLVEAEFYMLLNFSDYNFKFTSSNKVFIADNGRVIRQPSKASSFDFTITITGSDGYNEEVTLSSRIDGKN